MLQAQQLVSLACEICQAPGKTVQAGQMLNLILANYALTLDLTTTRLTTTLNIGPQAVTPYFYALPSNYLRHAEKPFYNVLGTVYQAEEMPLEELDGAYTANGISNYPEWFATDMSATAQATAGSSPSMAFYPPPAVPLAVTLRYYPSSLDIATPESSTNIPYYPDQLVLLKELCIMVGDVAGGEDRTLRWEREIDKRMSKYLAMDDDKEGYSQQVKLDARYFRRNSNLPPSKLLGF